MYVIGTAEGIGIALTGLMSYIYNASEEVLAALAQQWGVTLTGNRRQDIPALYKEMTDPWSVQTVLEDITAAELTILGEILTHPRAWRPISHLRSKLPFHELALQEHLHLLSKRGLVWTLSAYVRGNDVLGQADPKQMIMPATLADTQIMQIAYIPSDLARILVPAVAAMGDKDRDGESLHAYLNREEPRMLQQIAAHWKVLHPFGYFKRELILHIEEAMSIPGALETLVTELTPLQQTIYQFVMKKGGKAALKEIRRELALADGAIRDAVREMRDTFLLHEGHDQAGQRVLFVPGDIVRGHIAMPLRENAPKLVSVPTPLHSRNAEYALAWDILGLLAFIEQNDIILNQSDMRMPKRTRARMLGLLIGNGEDAALNELRLDFIYHMMARLHLIRRRDTRLTVSDKGRQWTKLSFAEQTARLYSFWTGDHSWREPFQLDVPFFGPTNLAPLRQRLSSWLNDAQPDVWYSMDSLQARVQALDPHIIRGVQQKITGAARPTDLSGWYQIEAHMLNALFATTLYWLGAGAIDSGADKPVAPETTTGEGRSSAPKSTQRVGNGPRILNFSITELGAWLFGLPDAPMPVQHEPAILIQPTFEVLVFQSSAPLVFMLNRIASLVRADRVAVYQLNRDALLRTLDTTDLSISDIIAFLSRANKRDLPQNVLYSLNDWARGYRRIALSDVILLEVDDPTILDQLERQMPDILVRRLSHTSAIVRGDMDEDALVRQLRNEGYFPRWTESGETAKPDENTKKWTAAES